MRDQMSHEEWSVFYHPLLAWNGAFFTLSTPNGPFVLTHLSLQVPLPDEPDGGLGIQDLGILIPDRDVQIEISQIHGSSIGHGSTIQDSM